ncbi:MAG: 50S ribosomal protein L13 [Candidatus Sumerlaeia bacterium]
MKTFMPKPGDIQEQWFLVDVQDQVLGRVASQIAALLRGKNSPQFTPHANMRNHVVVINADKVRLTGNKWREKTYIHHTGWVGHLRSATAEELLEKNPTELIRHAVSGMLPKTRLGKATLKRLRTYAGADHDHQAQKPVPVDLAKRSKLER